MTPKHILVSEDDTDILGLVRAVLEDAGYSVGSAVGAGTLAAVEATRPDLILLDYQMPGMDGITVARGLRSNPDTSTIPIIAMTAAGHAQIVCHEMDADGYLGKPFDIDELVNAVDQMIHETG
jgi:CheY-like chemotaxis protein